MLGVRWRDQRQRRGVGNVRDAGDGNASRAAFSTRCASTGAGSATTPCRSRAGADGDAAAAGTGTTA